MFGALSAFLLARRYRFNSRQAQAFARQQEIIDHFAKDKALQEELAAAAKKNKDEIL